MSCEWIKTTKEVYRIIYIEHGENFQVFGTCSAPEGNPMLGIMRPYMLTEWGFKDAAEPIIKSIATKKNKEQKNYDYEYFISRVVENED